jgi:glycerophosphoryl diester phosphodiesterase
MRSLLDLGVDGIVTDRPDLLRDVLRSRDAWPA